MYSKNKEDFMPYHKNRLVNIGALNVNLFGVISQYSFYNHDGA
jgi:hypothetical protein